MFGGDAIFAFLLATGPAAGELEKDVPKGDAASEATPEAPAPNAGLRAVGVIGGDDSAKVWGVVVSTQFRTLAVADEDPRNDRSMHYGILGQYRVWDTLTLRLRLGLAQRFVAEADDSAFRFQDVRLGALYVHGIPWELPSWAGSLAFVHLFDVVAPTSRQSLNQSLILALQQTSIVSWAPGYGLTVGLSETWQQRFHQYAEQAGLTGGMNVRSVLVGRAFISYSPVASVTLGADVYGTWYRKYDSREAYETELSDEGFWGQDFGWDVFVAYRPVRQLEIALSLEHAQSVRDGGTVRTHFLNRDETELALSLRGIF